MEEAAVSSKDLVQIPIQERKTTTQKRSKLPSMNFTSNEHFAKRKRLRPNPKKKKK